MTNLSTCGPFLISSYITLNYGDNIIFSNAIVWYLFWSGMKTDFLLFISLVYCYIFLSLNFLFFFSNREFAFCSNYYLFLYWEVTLITERMRVWLNRIEAPPKSIMPITLCLISGNQINIECVMNAPKEWNSNTIFFFSLFGSEFIIL